MKSIFEQTGGTYRREDDDLIPDLFPLDISDHEIMLAEEVYE